MKTLFTVTILLLPILSRADEWACKSQSSIRSGNGILACGVATEASLEQARMSALQNAKHEFEAICSVSASCRDFDVLAEAKRTDCTRAIGGSFTCYRAVEYEILKSRKRDIRVNIDEVEAEIRQRQAELTALQAQMLKQQELRQLDDQVDYARTTLADSQPLEKAEIGLERLKGQVEPKAIANREYSYDGLNKMWSLGLGAGYSAIPKFGDARGAYVLSLHFERRLGSSVGIRAGFKFGSDLYSKEPETTGAANSNRQFRGPMKITDFSISLPYYWGHQIYVIPECGQLSLSRNDKAVGYSALGTKTTSSDVPYSENKTYVGLGFGFVTEPVDAVGSKYFIELSGKRLSGISAVEPSLQLGFQLGF